MGPPPRPRASRAADGPHPRRIEVIRKVAELREAAEAWRREGRSIGLVPTMGALHGGHLSLVAAANRENQRTVVSIFVNPLQFGPAEDFQRYPRPFERDLHLLAATAKVHADLVFAPDAGEMYRTQEGAGVTRVRVHELEDPLEGIQRPGHFEGVATIVTKLFNTARPDHAYFGQKDAQQAALIQRLVTDLDYGIEIRVCPIIREADGLALSSRNAYLSPEQRRAAGSLFRALAAANDLHLRGGEDPARMRAAMWQVLESEPAVTRIDYAEIVDPRTFTTTFTTPARLAVLAARLGPVRLIDNHRLGDPLRPGAG